MALPEGKMLEEELNRIQAHAAESSSVNRPSGLILANQKALFKPPSGYQ